MYLIRQLCCRGMCKNLLRSGTVSKVITARQGFHRMWVVNEKSLVKRANVLCARCEAWSAEQSQSPLPEARLIVCTPRAVWQVIDSAPGVPAVPAVTTVTPPVLTLTVVGELTGGHRQDRWAGHVFEGFVWGALLTWEFFFFFQDLSSRLRHLCVVVGILAFSSWINCSETHLIKIVCWWFKFDGKKTWAMTYCLISSLLQRIRQKSMLCHLNMGPDGKCRCP